MEGYLISRGVEAVAVGLVGAFMGSFLNVVSLNVSRLESIVRRRSRCEHCREELRWFELIPLLSYLIQFGHCRRCRQKIAASYFWVETGTALLFSSLYLALAPGWSWWQLLALLAAVSGWVVLFLDDWRTMSIDTGLFFRVAWLLTALSVASNAYAAADWGLVGTAAFGAVVGYGTLWLIRVVGTSLLKQEAMGDGDPLVGALVGALVGWPLIVLTLFLSFIIGSIIGLLPMLWRGRVEALKEVPFTPALFLAGWVALVWGRSILDWYLGVL